MSNACSLDLTARKRAETGYTDELAEQFALEAGGLAPRPNEQKDETNERGVFVRQPNSFIRPFGDREGDLRAEANRFAIYWAHGCNWSNRPVIARDLLGLENVIADQTTTHTGETNRYGHGFADEILSIKTFYVIRKKITTFIYKAYETSIFLFACIIISSEMSVLVIRKL